MNENKENQINILKQKLLDLVNQIKTMKEEQSIILNQLNQQINSLKIEMKELKTRDDQLQTKARHLILEKLNASTNTPTNLLNDQQNDIVSTYTHS